MKRLIALLLALMLLAGCAVQEPEPSTVPTTETTEPPTEATAPPGAPLYIPDSDLEQQTDGAVKVFNVHKSCYALYPMGEKLLLFFPKTSAHQILVYAGAELSLQYGVNTGVSVGPDELGVRFSENGMSYYNGPYRQIVLLDGDLEVTDRVDLPADAQGTPVMDAQQKHIFYCTQNEIRALDMETGIARLLRQEDLVWQSVYDVCFDGRVLLCDVIDSKQNGYLAYIDTTTGKLLGKDSTGWDFHNYRDAFLMTNTAGNAMYGTWDTEVLELITAGDVKRVWELLSLGGALAVSAEDDGFTLNYYDLKTGLRTASVTIPAAREIFSVAADTYNHCVWFMVENTSRDQILCRWDYEKSGVSDETVYLQPRYTEDDPDVEGLKQLKAKADALAAANSMEIRIWKDAVQAPWTNLKSDYRVSSFRNSLEDMESVLSAFPQGIMDKLASLSLTGVISVSIVYGQKHHAQSHFQWIDHSTYIALETGDNGEDAFCDALYRVMDTYLLNSNSMLDEWDSDEPVNDRAKIFRYAMSADKAHYFEDDDAQDKLEQLCESIRDAFDLDDYEGELRWEQYLED